MLDEILYMLGIENDADTELIDLEKNVHPQDVMKEMERVQQQQMSQFKRNKTNKHQH